MSPVNGPIPNPNTITLEQIIQLIRGKFPNELYEIWHRTGGDVVEVKVGSYRIKASVTDDLENFPDLVGEAWLAVTEEVHNVEQVLLQFETRDLKALNDRIDWAVAGMKESPAFASPPEPTHQQIVDLEQLWDDKFNPTVSTPSEPVVVKDPITVSQVVEAFASRFPHLEVKENPRLGGMTLSVRLWHFRIEVSVTTAPLGIPDIMGEVWIATYLDIPEASSQMTVRGRVTRELSVLHEELDWAVKYLTGISAAIEMALEPLPPPQLGIYSDISR